MGPWVDEHIQKRDNTDSVRDRAKKAMVGEWRAEFSCMADFTEGTCKEWKNGTCSTLFISSQS